MAVSTRKAEVTGTARPPVAGPAADGPLRHGLQFLPFVTVTVGLALLSGRYSLWRDEAFTAKQAQMTFAQLVRALWGTHSSDAAQPLYYLLLWPWQRLVGTGEVVMRLPSLAMTVAAAWALARAARRLLPSLPSSCFGLLLSLPVIVWYAIEARAYALILLLVSLHLLESVRLLRGASRTPVRLAVTTLLVTAAYTVAGCAAIAAFVLVVWAWRRSQHEEGAAPPPLRSASSALQGAVLALCLLLIGFSAVRGREAAGPEARSPAATVAYTGYELALGRSVGFSVRELRVSSATVLAREHPSTVALVGVVVLLLAVVAAQAARGLARSGLQRYASLAVPWLLVGLAFAGYSILADLPLLGRHLLFVVPSVVLLLTVGLGSSSPRSIATTTAVLWLVGLVALGGIGLSHRYDKEDFRGVVDILARCGLAPQDVAVAAPVDGLRYYDATFSTAPELDVGRAMSLLTSGAKEAAVVDTNHFDPKGALSTDVARQAGLQAITITDFRIISHRSLDACSGTTPSA